MKLLSPTNHQDSAFDGLEPVDDFDPKTVGYIRLLSAVLEEPAADLTRQLEVSEAIVDVLTIEEALNAA